MAKHSSNILELAARGAKHRYEELQAEIAALVKTFPHLRAKKGGKRPFPFALEARELPHAPRKRRKMSAKARKAIGDAQRARWAKQRAGQKK